MMDWRDSFRRAIWTFLEAFLGVLAAAQAFALEGAALLSATAAGLAAAIVPLKDYALHNRPRAS